MEEEKSKCKRLCRQISFLLTMRNVRQKRQSEMEDSDWRRMVKVQKMMMVAYLEEGGTLGEW